MSLFCLVRRYILWKQFSGGKIMKKSRLITAFLTAVTAASMLSVTSYAGYIPEGYTPVCDITPTVEGSLKEKRINLGGGHGKVEYYYLDKNGEVVTGRNLLYCDRSDENELYSDMRMRTADKKTGRITGYFTGFTKGKAGKRYYVSGERIYGWYKVGNNWYHFDEKGYADTGRVKICGAYYTFDKNGKWTGKVSKSGIVPKDFVFSFTTSGSAFDSNGYIYYGKGAESEDDADFRRYETQVKFSARDRQIFYCMLLESGFADGKDYRFDNEYFCKKEDEIKKKSGREILYTSVSEHETVYTLEYTLNGKNGSVKFGFDSRQLTNIDKECFNAYCFAKSAGDYRTYYLYEKYPAPEGVFWNMFR